MRRHIVTAFAALSLLLCVAVCALWVRSYWRADAVNWNGTSVDWAVRSGRHVTKRLLPGAIKLILELFVRLQRHVGPTVGREHRDPVAARVQVARQQPHLRLLASDHQPGEDEEDADLIL